uniref:Uncharacterized protein n=1 Tax=Megaselia scalaris TaxID=36166 RepID=T1GJ82_MEGSC
MFYIEENTKELRPSATPVQFIVLLKDCIGILHNGKVRIIFGFLHPRGAGGQIWACCKGQSQDLCYSLGVCQLESLYTPYKSQNISLKCAQTPNEDKDIEDKDIFYEILEQAFLPMI